MFIQEFSVFVWDYFHLWINLVNMLGSRMVYFGSTQNKTVHVFGKLLSEHVTRCNTVDC